jgi:hypothetical protein
MFGLAHVKQATKQGESFRAFALKKYEAVLIERLEHDFSFGTHPSAWKPVRTVTSVRF